MVDFNKLKRSSYVSKRMFIIKKICEENNVDLEYLFGLFNLYNQKNSGRWFWQKAKFTGALKDRYDEFNEVADKIAKAVRRDTEAETESKIMAAKELLNKLMQGMEMNLEVDRGMDRGYVRGFLDDNLKTLIDDSLKGLV